MKPIKHSFSISNSKQKSKFRLERDEEALMNKDLRTLVEAEQKVKATDVMTQITFAFKKLEIKDTRKRVERSLKRRKTMAM